MRDFIILPVSIITLITVMFTFSYYVSTTRVYYLNSDDTITSERAIVEDVEAYKFESPSLSDTIVRVFDKDFNLIYVAPIGEVPRRVSVQQ